jgi:hypothetical protein
MPSFFFFAPWIWVYPSVLSRYATPLAWHNKNFSLKPAFPEIEKSSTQRQPRNNDHFCAAEINIPTYTHIHIARYIAQPMAVLNDSEHAYTRMHTHMHTYIHTYTHTFIHTSIHIQYMHTCTLADCKIHSTAYLCFEWFRNWFLVQAKHWASDCQQQGTPGTRFPRSALQRSRAWSERKSWKH